MESPNQKDDIFDIYEAQKEEDKLFCSSVSLKRRLSIIEKILTIICAIVIIPLTSLLCSYIHFGDLNQSFTNPNEFNPFGKDFIYTIAPYIVSLIVLLLFEFISKNNSIKKGLFRTSFVSLFLSLVIYSTSFGLIISFQFTIQRIALDAILISNYLLLGIIASVTYTLVLFIIRIVLRLIDRNNKKYAMIIGPKEDADNLCKRIIRANRKRFSVRFVFYEINGEISRRIKDKTNKVNTIILLDTLSTQAKEKILLFFNSTLNKDVYLCTTYYDIISYSQTIKNISADLSYEENPLIIDHVEMFFKRIFDIILSTILMILCLPFWIIIPIAIKLNSKGPVFFKQIRYTKGLKQFTIYKFRSMYVDSDANTLNTVNDKRVTKVGKILRATRIDEIPQIINVFKGDMSFIGPRAWMQSVVEEGLRDIPEFKYRFNVKAGITGLQQVSTKAGASTEEKIKYDLYYIEHYSMVMDISILFKTVATIFKKDMSEGIETSDKELYDYLLERGILTNLHWDYRSLIYPKNVDRKEMKEAEDYIRETIEIHKISKLDKNEQNEEESEWKP